MSWWDTLTGAASTAAKDVEGAVSTIGSDAAKAASATQKAGSNAFSTAGNYLKSGISGISNAFSKLGSTLSSAFSAAGNAASLPSKILRYVVFGVVAIIILLVILKLIRGNPDKREERRFKRQMAREKLARKREIHERRLEASASLAQKGGSFEYITR